MRERILEIKNLEVVYQTSNEMVHAVNGITMNIEKGRTLGLVGETGAGKTTTALAILNLLPERTARIKGGDILFEGKSVFEMNSQELRTMRGGKISMIFQDPMTALNPIMTVGDQIREALELHNIGGLSDSELDAKVDEVLELVGIPAKRKNSYPHEFSGGMKQRVVIAIALVCSPELLIADEPTTALDVTIQAQILAMMNELKVRLNTSMILITHDLGIVARICDDVAIMYAGEIIEQGLVEEIFDPERTHHPYTVGLFGSIPDLDSETERLHPIEGLMPDPTNLPSGCKFSPRCPRCMDICKEFIPETVNLNGHLLKCHLVKKEETNE